MRLVLCWAAYSGYTAACWRALAARSDVDLHVIALDPRHGSGRGENQYDDRLLAGLNCRVLSSAEQDDDQLIAALARERKPDVLYTTGWFLRGYRRLVLSREFSSVPKWLGVDTPWVGSLRQHVARGALRRFVRRAERVIVAGERSWQYMRRLGVPESRLRRGLYGFDHLPLLRVHERRLASPAGWPRRFLFVGRYAPEKGIETLLEAYRRYRCAVPDPWPLTMCGNGPLRGLVAVRTGEGVEDRGFVQPAELPQVWSEHGAFVLPSLYEPWGVVIAEAAGAGLPVVCSEACGASVEIVRGAFNGLTVATHDADALARGMRWMHDHRGGLPEMGRRGRELAAAYSAEAWATRWAEAARECLGE